ncbi:hypothetical protein K0504_03925 [Neiella marina]|uniref:Uncharacterized protein n=1 Tax=Neiella holothuriorum TaxID=2870530 RepID=A0ABS7ED66_9GAMM|nr:hypothetical protein [Neiella holothuriorum]MBW8190175.1 hypothetical protein [Neiella holothuriorum]
MTSIQGSMSNMMPPPPKGQNSTTLTEEQSQLITETLEQYDADNLTEADAKAIVETFSEAGIQPSEAFAAQLDELGFDAKAIGDSAGMDGPPPPPPPGEQVASLSITEEMLSELNTLLNEMSEGNLSDDEQANTLSRIKDIFEQGMPEGGLVDITV